MHLSPAVKYTGTSETFLIMTWLRKNGKGTEKVTESELCGHGECCATLPLAKTPAEEEHCTEPSPPAPWQAAPDLQQELYVPLISDSCPEQANTIPSAVPDKYPTYLKSTVFHIFPLTRALMHNSAN